ncbi:MAG: glycosyltransferase family 2 protein [Parvibaculum sp.]
MLGSLAVKHGLIAQDTLKSLLDLQANSNARLGDIMVSAGHLRRTELARLLSEQAGVEYVDLRVAPIDATLTHAQDLDFYIEQECLPWRGIDNETIYVAADPARARHAIEEREGRHCIILFASPRTIQHTIRERFYLELSERARLDLALKYPDSSAHNRLSDMQFWGLLGLIVVVIGFFCLAPSFTAVTFNILCGTCFLSIGLLKGLAIYFGRHQTAGSHAEDIPDVNDAELPLYSIIVPLFREAAVLPILTDALCKLDYPSAKQQILLVFEETDIETYEAAKALRLPGHIEFIRVPHSLPLTKPKACNYALPFARGEYLVVYDAEDLPDPDQLKKAIAAFQKGSEKLACVQAHLTYYNCFENWMTRQFTLEYATLFDLILPMLERFNLPIPLGGTSTHFRTSILREAGAWDPFNVTEDADLGMRLAMLGWRTGIIQSTTYEEANCRLDNWLRQRSRWIKGWIQTYLVRMRHPIQLYKALGLKGFLGFQIMIGGFPLSSLVHPVFYISMILILLTQAGHSGEKWFDPIGQFTFIAVFNILVLVSGYSISILASMTAAANRGLRPLILSSLTLPAYWLLISLGAYRALFSLISRPFHWEKTDHGLSRLWAEKRASALHDMSQQNKGANRPPVTWR